MKRLWLFRHAKAVPAETAASDFARPLAERGERDARWIVERLCRHDSLPNRILASTAQRTRRTAEIAAEGFGQPVASIVLDERLYLASARTILAAIAATGDDVDSLLVVGHNPGLSELAELLMPNLPFDDLPTSGLVGFAADTDAWTAVAAGAPRLRYYDFPKNTSPPIKPH